MAIKYQSTNQPHKKSHTARAIVYINNTEWGQTEAMDLWEDDDDPNNNNESSSSSNEIIFSIPVILPTTRQAPGNGTVSIQLLYKSGVGVGGMMGKSYTVGVSHFALKDLVHSKECEFSGSVNSEVIPSGHDPRMEVYCVRDRKYPQLGGLGWSLTDAMPIVCMPTGSEFSPPLEQLYVLSLPKPREDGFFAKRAVLAIERTQESSIVVPIAASCARLFGEAIVISARHAKSVLQQVKARNLEFENPMDAYANHHADCNVDFSHFVKFVDGTDAAPNRMSMQQANNGGNGQQQQSFSMVKLNLQSPDCVFERKLGSGQIPVYNTPGGNLGTHAIQYQTGVGVTTNVVKTTTIQTVSSATIPFYPKVCPPNASTNNANSNPKWSVGVLRFEMQIDSGGNMAFITSNYPMASGGAAHTPNSNKAGIAEGYVHVDPHLTDNPTSDGVMLEIPMYETYPTNRLIGLLNLKLTARIIPDNANTVPATPTPATSGLLSLFNMTNLTDGSPLDSLTNHKPTVMGDLLSTSYLSSHSLKRETDAKNLASRYQSYIAAIPSHPNHQPNPELAKPQYARKCPSPFRPSSSKTHEPLSMIPFNTHVQSLVLEPLDQSIRQVYGAWHNVTCGAAADHPRGFNASSSRPGGAGGIRRIKRKQEETARFATKARAELRNALKNYFTQKPNRRHVEANDGYMNFIRESSIKAEAKLHDVNWELAVRMANCFSQALCQGVTAYLAALSDPNNASVASAQMWVTHGFLLCYEGLLSAAGKEMAMIEDASGALELLSLVDVVIVPGTPENTAMATKKVNVGGSRVIQWLELLPKSNNTATAGTTTMELKICIENAFYTNRLPSPLQNNAAIKFHPILFQMGVDIRQWGANTSSKLAQQPSQIAKSNSFSQNQSDDVTEMNNEITQDETDFLKELNYEAFQKLNRYAFSTEPLDANNVHSQPLPGGPNNEPIHPILCMLWGNIKDSARKMEHGVLDSAASAGEKLNGSGIVFCKSGKDRTAMQCTLKQSQFISKTLPYRNQPASSSSTGSSRNGRLMADATLMRTHGTRLALCAKNVGEPKYAFNAIQAKFMPEMLKPPLTSVAGILKGEWMGGLKS